jgi:hypothetical protein
MRVFVWDGERYRETVFKDSTREVDWHTVALAPAGGVAGLR